MPFRAFSPSTGVSANATGALSGTTQVGDIQLAFVLATLSSVTITTVPSGWSLVRALTPTGFKTWVYSRVRQAGDTTAPVWAMSASNGWSVDIWSGYGQDPTNPINVHNGNVATGTSAVSAAVTPTVADCMIVSHFGADTGTGGQGRTFTVSGSPTPSGLTERVDVGADTFYRVVADDQLVGQSGVSVTRTGTVTGGTTPLAGLVVAIAPAPVVATGSFMPFFGF